MSYKDSPFSLDGVCTAIYGDYLYAYSTNGFAKLSLKSGGEWTKLNTGVVVSDAICVGASATDAANSGLYIMGGGSTNASYTGLQKYTYATGVWETITTSDSVLKNRRGMSAKYIPATDSFITYGGLTDGSYGVASQTFSIKAHAPYTVQSATNPFSYTLQTPIMADWDAGEVIMAGGSPSNLNIIIYNAGTNTWRESGANLADSIPKVTDKGYIQTGQDGSKNLYTFDLTQSPVRVTRAVIQNSGGGFVTKSPTIVTSRSLTTRDWPAYNSTFAPSSVSSDVYSSASDSDNQVYFVTSDSSNPISIFDASDNSWLDVKSVLGSQSVMVADIGSSSTSSAASSSTKSASSSSSTSKSSVTSSASSSSSTATGTSSSELVSASATATHSASSTAAAATVASSAAATSAASNDLAATKDGLSSNDVLGIALGSVFGFLLLLICILLCIKTARRRKGYTGEKARSHQAYPTDEKNVGMTNEQFIDSLGGAPGTLRQNNDSVDPHSSLAMFGAKPTAAAAAVRSESPSSSSGSRNGGRRNSQDSQFAKEFKSTISKPIVGEHPALQAAGTERISINSPGRSPPRPPGSHTVPPQPPINTDASRRSSGWNKYWSQNSGALNILGYGKNQDKDMDAAYDNVYGHDNYNRRTQDSATVPPLIMPREGRPELNRVASGSPTVAQYNKYLPAQAQVASIERPISDAPSIYSSGVPPSVQEAWEPISAQNGWNGESVYGAPGQALSDPYQQQQAQNPQLAMAGTQSDMSWLNLGEYNKRAN